MLGIVCGEIKQQKGKIDKCFILVIEYCYDATTYFRPKFSNTINFFSGSF